MLARALAGARRRGIRSRLLKDLASPFSSAASPKPLDYDLIVLGGGSAGLACSKEAATLGARVAVLDYVQPSPRGTAWGLGGTCVNAGCIPKKLMHQAAQLGIAVEDARSYGWNVPNDLSHSWGALTSAIKSHIKSLNWGHRVQLKQRDVDYFNAMGSFVDRHTVEARHGDGSTSLLTSKYCVIAVGGRPVFPSNVPGAAEYGITSDDLFFLEEAPGKTIVVGGGYIALECAGFLAGLGCPASLLVRSQCLRAFDQDVVAMVTKHLEEQCGVRFLRRCEPRRLERRGRGGRGQLCLTWQSLEDGREEQEVCDTVVFATGRAPSLTPLLLARVGVAAGPAGVLVDRGDTTSVPNIFAVGDATPNKRSHLSPVAVRAGKLIASRLFGGGSEFMDYDLVPTTVFTPLEYAAVGLTESAAQVRAPGAVEVYHAFYRPLQTFLPARDASQCYIKMVCVVEGGRGRGEGAGGGGHGREERVVGLHITGASAAEVMQGFAVAIKRGLTMAELAASLPLHPTSAEEVVKLHVSKSSGLDPTATAC